jgi:hypothetical protein
MICPYCGNNAVLVGGKSIYPHRSDLYRKWFYLCQPCDAYVGCHPNKAPLGRLANRQLRIAKMQAHSVFDPLWKEGQMTRTQAYKWLSEKMKIPVNETHIGLFDIGQCLQVEQIVKDENARKRY